MAKILKVNLPFEGTKWIIDLHGDVFGTYATKAEAVRDARDFGLTIKR